LKFLLEIEIANAIAEFEYANGVLNILNIWTGDWEIVILKLRLNEGKCFWAFYIDKHAFNQDDIKIIVKRLVYYCVKVLPDFSSRTSRTQDAETPTENTWKTR
jgi:hypothetical protein